MKTIMEIQSINSHAEIILINSKGDTFTIEVMDSRNEGLIDFLDGFKEHHEVKNLTISDVSKRIISEKLSIAEKALNDIRNWNDDLEYEYQDQGYRAIEALEQIQSVC